MKNAGDKQAGREERGETKSVGHNADGISRWYFQDRLAETGDGLIQRATIPACNSSTVSPLVVARGCVGEVLLDDPVEQVSNTLRNGPRFCIVGHFALVVSRAEGCTNGWETENGGAMSNILDEVLSANEQYSRSFGDRGKLAMPPARGFAILTCMDARLDPAKYAGLAEGDAHVIRNAGGRASDDAIRSLVISYKLLGTHEFFVIHHTNCGMEFFTNDVIRGLLANSLETAQLTSAGFKDVGKGPGSRAGEFIEWLTVSDQQQAVLDDVQRIRNHPLVPGSIPIYGYIYDVASGKLLEVPGARQAGAAR